jgi:hypothetical protein
MGCWNKLELQWQVYPELVEGHSCTIGFLLSFKAEFWERLRYLNKQSVYQIAFIIPVHLSMPY